jgi:integrase
VKRSAASLGLNPAHFGGHSLRAGFVTTGFANGLNEISLATQTGHKSLNNLRRYLRQSDPFAGNASGMVGL